MLLNSVKFIAIAYMQTILAKLTNYSLINNLLMIFKEFNSFVIF
jgi:hypothetical protein